MMSFPQIGAKPISDFIYALLSVWVRMHELAFGLVDFIVVAVVGDIWSGDLCCDEEKLKQKKVCGGQS